MPGFTTHYLFGENIKDEIDDKHILRVIKNHEKCFNLGLQGPDIFFYYLPAYFAKRNIGNVMHDTNTLDYFENLIDARNEVKNIEIREKVDAYILGFIGHYSMDTICHPYIYSRSHYVKYKDDKSRDFGNHVALETDIDKTMLSTCLGKRPTDFKPEDTINLCEKDMIDLSHVIFKAIRRTYPHYFITPFRIRNAMRFMRLENKWMKDKTGIKKFTLRSIEQILYKHSFISSMIPSDKITRYKDCCNERHATWRNPWNPSVPQNDSFFELVTQASNDYLRRIELYAEVMACKPGMNSNDRFRSMNQLLGDLGDCSYLSGLPL